MSLELRPSGDDRPHVERHVGGMPQNQLIALAFVVAGCQIPKGWCNDRAVRILASLQLSSALDHAVSHEGSVIALVDFDNIPALERSRGLAYVATRIVDALGAAAAIETQIRFRLYGGWFNGGILSRRAQQLVPIIQSDFPRTIIASAGSPPARLVARAELATSLECAPGRYLTHTYRDRALPGNVTCAPLPYVGCPLPGACPLAPVAALIRDQECTEPQCAVTLAKVLTKPEQKLVDTMIAVDLVHLAHVSQEVLVVVSADDDIWPGIQLALVRGAQIVHVHPLPGRITPVHYSSLATGRYSQASF